MNGASLDGAPPIIRNGGSNEQPSSPPSPPGFWRARVRPSPGCKEGRRATQAPVQERVPLACRSDARTEVAQPAGRRRRRPPPVKDRSCAVRMSPHDYERLGILAVKTGTTRQPLLKQALAQFLAAKAEDYGCACLGACERNCGQAC